MRAASMRAWSCNPRRLQLGEITCADFDGCSKGWMEQLRLPPSTPFSQQLHFISFLLRSKAGSCSCCLQNGSCKCSQDDFCWDLNASFGSITELQLCPEAEVHLGQVTSSSQGFSLLLTGCGPSLHPPWRTVAHYRPVTCLKCCFLDQKSLHFCQLLQLLVKNLKVYPETLLVFLWVLPNTNIFHGFFLGQ